MGHERDNNLSTSHLIYMASRCRSSMPVMVNNNAQYYSPETASSMALLSANLLVPNALSPLGTVLSRTTLSRSLFLTDLFRSFSHKGLVTLSNRSFLGPKPDWCTYSQFGAARTENIGLTYFFNWARTWWRIILDQLIICSRYVDQLNRLRSTLIFKDQPNHLFLHPNRQEST